MAKLLESGENYLETILRLKKEKGEVRSIDIANSLNYSKASISRAMGIMKRGGYITIDEKGFINFTKKAWKGRNPYMKGIESLLNIFKQT